MLSCMIDAMKVPDVATDDIPVGFLQTDCDRGDIHIKIEGSMVTILDKIDPAYYKYFIYIDIP